MRRLASQVIVAVALLLIAACGGGGGSSPQGHDTAQNYSGAAGERHSYAPYFSGSYFYLETLEEDHFQITIGGDLEPRETLRHIGTYNGVQYFLGQSRDGVGVERLEKYSDDLTTRDGTDRFNLHGDGF